MSEPAVIDQLMEGGGEAGLGSAIRNAAKRLGCEEATLQAILEVESRGEPYDAKGRLIILVEKHIFRRMLPQSLRARAERAGLAKRSWSRSNYGGQGGPGSDRRWALLKRMTEMHETAGLKSASYGGPQIMGFNHRAVGYGTVQDFVLAMAANESSQVEAFVRFLESVGLAEALRQRDFRTVARKYNGSGQVTRYARMMERAYTRIKGKPPQIRGEMRRRALRVGSEGFRVRALQERLNELGYPTHVDGDFGDLTENSVLAFQKDNGLTIDGVVGPQTEAALEVAVPRSQRPAQDREDMTVSDLRKRGSQTVKHADRGGLLGWIAALFGGAVTVAENDGLVAAVPIVGEQVSQAVETVAPATSWLASNLGLALVLFG
ncbi:MAG: N-acetylmuramidase domain-containing protein, partial [Pseudomonadota bacterium]